MVITRPAAARGHFNHGWLDTYHTFSFADYYDPAHMGFRALRVINEDRVEPGRGFPTHAHRDMEIITVVLDGALQHKDSMGNGSIIRPGEVQRMSAGTGVTHSEYNASRTELVHLLQIWILPAQAGLPPSYEQRRFESDELDGRWRLLAAPDAADGAVTVHQDARLLGTILQPANEIEYRLANGRHAWVQVARGHVRLNGTPLDAGDGAAVSNETAVRVCADSDAELLLFDLA